MPARSRHFAPTLYKRKSTCYLIDMNHIERLTRQGSASQAEIFALLDGIAALRGYLSSDKFAADPTVQVADVDRRLQEIVAAARAAHDEGWSGVR